MGKTTISAIAAMAKNRVIGKNGAMPWHISEDLKNFKKLTLGKPVIMGRKTYESLGKPLPGRTNIVISRRGGSVDPQGAQWVPNLDEALTTASAHSSEEIFIIGGGEIYKQSLPRIDRLYLTLIDRNYDGDAYFPEFDWKDWEILGEEKHESDPAFTFFTLEKK